MEFELVKTLFALIVVLGLMFVVVAAMKKFLRMSEGRRSEIVDIEVLSQKAIQPKRMLYVVKVLNKVIIVSSTEQGIHPLGEITDESAVRTLETRQETLRLKRASAGSIFKQKLYSAETLGEFFHRPFNVILWRGDKPGVVSAANAQEGTDR